jgi:hypothetical protein
VPVLRPSLSTPRALLSALAVCLVAVLALASTAQADEPFNPTLEAEYAAALAFWGVSSPPQCEEVRRVVMPTDPGSVPGEGGAAAATQPAPGVIYAWCELHVFADEFPTGACLQQEAMDHEVGHLLGYGHSEDPTNIMYPSLQPWVWCPAEAPPPVNEPTTECRQTKRHPDGICLPAGSFPPEKHHRKKRARSSRTQASAEAGRRNQ